MRDDRGSAVAEFAVAMPAVMLVLALALGGVGLTGLQLRAQDAAADAARTWARGDGSGRVAAQLARQVPHAHVSRSGGGDLVCATVSARAPGVLARFGLTVSARSCALGGGR